MRRSDLTDLVRCVCRSFIRPSISFFVFYDRLKLSERSDFRRNFLLDKCHARLFISLCAITMMDNSDEKYVFVLYFVTLTDAKQL